MNGEAMRFDREDWRLSAFVAGELEDEEREAVLALLAEDEEASEFVEELRATAATLESALAREATFALRAEQREAVLHARRWFPGRHVAAAAVLVATAVTVAVAHRVPAGADERTSAWSPRHREYVGAREGAVRSDDSGAAAGRERALQFHGYLEALGYLAGDAYHGPGDSVPAVRAAASRDRYDAVSIPGFRRARDEAWSTFSIDVDTASYANVRRFLREGALPPPGAVRVEEFVNAFEYDDPPPQGEVPFSVTTEVASCPWAPRNRLVRIGLKGRAIDWSDREAANLVFLLDVSGSMSSPDKLPLLQRSLRLLVEQLDHRDRVAIVVYAGAAGLVLPPTPGNRDGEIMGALERLDAGGSTNGGAGIELAYRLAEENFVPGGLNRVILATDGDFNVGVSDRSSLVELIERKRRSGVFLTVLGFGRGNLNDATMEDLADRGNGNYAYVDSLVEAKRVLVEQVGGTLIPVAKDVKIQVEFNPATVAAWRLLGYENRALAHEEFADDRRDAGEIGSGLSVTALYEVVPASVAYDGPVVAPSRSAPPPSPAPTSFTDELLFLRLRYKHPDGEASQVLETPVADARTPWTGASTDFRWAAAVAAFAELLRGSEHLGTFDLDGVRQVAWTARGDDPDSRRAEFLDLLDRARSLR